MFFSRKRRIAKTAILKNKNLIILGNNIDILDFVVIKTFVGKVMIGDNSQINPFSVIYNGENNIRIGNNVMIAPHVVIVGGQHNYKDINIPMRFAGSYSKGDVVIEDDVWIGANSIIMDGVKIGKGAVVAAGTIVLRDVNEYDVVAGNPMRILFNRKEKLIK